MKHSLKPTPEIHTVLGAGQIGLLLARRLARAGREVRLVRRNEGGPKIAGVRRIRGDITAPSFADEVCAGATTVYNCLSPAAYHRWNEELPPLWRGAMGGATRAGARLVVLDNLYMIGQAPTQPFDEQTKENPCSEKGELRAKLAEELFAAHRRGDVCATSGRASDFFGPHTPLSAIFHPRFFARLAKGKPVEVMGDPDQPHSYSYTPDVARGLEILGTHEHAPGRVWHLPVASQLTTRELIETFARRLGVNANVRVIPRWMLRAIGLFAPVVGAAVEMVYQWEGPQLVSDAQFCRTFNCKATTLDVAVESTLEAHELTPSVSQQRSFSAKT